MLRPVAGGGLPRVAQLVVGRIVEPDRERPDPPVCRAAHERRDDAGVHAAAEERADRHVADRPRADGVVQERAQPPGGRGHVIPRAGIVSHGPVPAERGPAARPLERVGRRQLADARKDRAGGRHVAQRDVLLQRLRVDLGSAGEGVAEAPELRGKGEDARALRVVEWLDAEPVPREQERLPRGVPQREREHAPQPAHAPRAVLLVEVDDDLRIAGGREAVAPREQVPPQLPVVEDLAVVHDPDRPVLVGDRLVAACEVDDAQPAAAQPRGAAQVQARCVGAPVRERLGHALQHGPRRRRARAVGDDPADAAGHAYPPPTAARAPSSNAAWNASSRRPRTRQSYSATARARAARPIRARRSGSRSRATASSANASGPSATTISSPGAACTPSVPRGVVSTGFCIAIAVKTRTFVPAPPRRGRTSVAARARYGRTSQTRPSTSMPGVWPRPRTAGGGPDPTTVTCTSATRRRIRGRISRAK